MCQLLETIQCKDGNLQNLEFHQKRFCEARKVIFGTDQPLFLADFIQIPVHAMKGLFRCRITYSKQIDFIEFLPYVYRKITSLKLVKNNQIDYLFKYKNREMLSMLFEQRNSCDDIIIVKNGFITDSFAANLVFWDGEKWWTPDSPLLRGTQRARLLEEGFIFEKTIMKNDLYKFKKAGLINAFNNLDNMPVIDIAAIKA